MRLRASLDLTVAAHVRNSKVCQHYIWPERAHTDQSAAPLWGALRLAMCGGPRLNCCFMSVGERKTYTQSAVITLEILVVTMEAFVSLLNGLPGHSLGPLIALNQYLGFSILLAAPVEGGGGRVPG